MDARRKDLGRVSPRGRPLRMLLVGPYDPHCGEYTFLAPPLGVWRLCGHLRALGHRAEVFDPNCCAGEPGEALRAVLAETKWDVVGISTTGMTLKYDLSLASITAINQPDALLIAGGMEATFDPELVSRLAPFDLIVLGEGEKPMKEIAERLMAGHPLIGIPGTAIPVKTGGVHRFHGTAMNSAELRRAILSTPYESMPFLPYWERLESAYSVDGLTEKGEREARLAEIRSIRVATLNYCPMACTFCSSTNFLHEAQGGVAKVARLTADDCLEIVRRIAALHPDVRTIIFQDDIFVFTQDKRIGPLCEGIVAMKASGELPAALQFISTNRIDAMTHERLRAMKQAGFRVLGFGVESFSGRVLKEFNKGQIIKHVSWRLNDALSLGITPFLDLILSSPASSVEDVAATVRQAYHWLSKGCEIGLYPYVIPFSGSAMSRDKTLSAYIEYETQRIPGTDVSWEQGVRILPTDEVTRETLSRIEAAYRTLADGLQNRSPHTPSRVRSLLWIAAAIPELQRRGLAMPDVAGVIARIEQHFEPQDRVSSEQDIEPVPQPVADTA